MHVNQLFDCTGKVAMITGGGRGLGLTIAKALAEVGASIVVCSRRLSDCEQAADEIRGLGVRARATACDVTHPEEIDRTVAAAIHEFGTIDILVNNSGTSWGAPALEMPVEAWDKVVETNLKGTFLVSQRVAREMIAQGGGSILNIASIAGLQGFQETGLDAVGYSASKAGVIGLTRDLAVKWAGYAIRVNAIAPGFFPTKMTDVILQEHGEFLKERTPLGRFGQADDIKGVVVLLASRAASYITGSVIVVDGGMTA